LHTKFLWENPLGNFIPEGEADGKVPIQYNTIKERSEADVTVSSLH
jgi:hypothetical protein